MNYLEDLLRQCTVKLNLPGGGWGTGFFVAPGWLLTCAHVVQNLEEQSVQVQWQNQENWAQAVIERSLPDPHDLALLRVVSSPDTIPPCVYLDDETVQARDLLSLFGYSQEFPKGCPAEFRCEGLTGDEPAFIKFSTGQVQPGMSGSPLLNQRTGKVCGIVKFTRDSHFDLGGGAVSTTVILDKFPELRQQQQLFHQHNDRWRTLLQEMSENESRFDSSQAKQVVKKILILSANPKKRASRRRAEEVDKIRRAVTRPEPRIPFEVQDRYDITADMLSQELSTIKPHIINISGRENGIKALFLENYADELGLSNSEKLIAQVLNRHAVRTECVILSGCYAEMQAREIAQHIKFVIGITQDLGDKQILTFLNEFYFFLGSGETIKYSYDAGYNLLQRQHIDEALLPILLSRDSEAKRRKLEERLSFCNEKIEENRNSVELWTEKAGLLRELERFEEADEAYERASSLDPANSEIRTEQGDTLEQIGEHEKAVAAYDKALQLKEDYKIWWKRGQALVEAGQYGEAIESYKKAVDLNPPLPDFYVICREYGSLLESLGQHQNSIRLYKLSLCSEPKYRAAAYQKRQAYKKLYSRANSTLF